MVQHEMPSLYLAEKCSATLNQKILVSLHEPACMLTIGTGVIAYLHCPGILYLNCPGLMGLTLPAQLLRGSEAEGSGRRSREVGLTPRRSKSSPKGAGMVAIKALAYRPLAKHPLRKEASRRSESKTVEIRKTGTMRYGLTHRVSLDA
jgi:hypothetical protein